MFNILLSFNDLAVTYASHFQIISLYETYVVLQLKFMHLGAGMLRLMFIETDEVCKRTKRHKSINSSPFQRFAVDKETF